MSKIEFSLPATGDQTFVLSEHLPCVVYFYPKDNTPGCTSESIAFATYHEEFEKLGVTIAGISRDSLKSHENFKAKYEMPFELLSDSESVVCTQFDVIKLKKMFGKESKGIERSTFFIDQNGEIAHEWRKVKVEGHVEEVLSTIKALLAK